MYKYCVYVSVYVHVYEHVYIHVYVRGGVQRETIEVVLVIIK